jgi:hypothetical protein
LCAALSAGCGGADERAEPQVLRLSVEPGSYTYLCSTGGYWRTQHGTLVVR